MTYGLFLIDGIWAPLVEDWYLNLDFSFVLAHKLEKLVENGG